MGARLRPVGAQPPSLLQLLSELAELTHTPPPTMTKLVARMVAGGLVYRQADPLDRRRVLAYATARGRQWQERLRSLIDASVADLSDDDRLRELVGELHRRLAPGAGSATEAV